ncbi:MAG: DMT family transporter [Bacteroidales bacterium]|nr:DMT family transporter [Bacteroidales bacterium]
MAHLGEISSLVVAGSWTATALFADEASHRLGSLTVNVIRLVLGSVFLGLILWFTIGAPYPRYADGPTWFWLALSALVGYLFGDFCLFNSYLVIGARFGQLFMTLAPPMAAIAGWIMLGETLSWRSILAMLVTISGIAISILAKGQDKKMHFTLPLKGILLGLGAGAGQGVGLVLSKVGMQHYEAALPADMPAVMGTMMPFAATQIRAIVGGLGFVIMLLLQRQGRHFLEVTRSDRKGVRAAILTTLFGPVLGVSLSLMAVQYARAGIASTLMALTPVLIILPYAIIHKQRVKPKELLGVAVSMLGVAMFFLL